MRWLAVLLIACGSHVQSTSELRWHHLRALRWALRDDDQPSRQQQRPLAADRTIPWLPHSPTAPEPVALDRFIDGL